MKVAFISYNHVSLEDGGGVGVQIRKTAEYLRKLGVEVDFFDMWKPFSVQDYDVYHFFPAYPFFEHFTGRVLKPMGAKIVVSPVFWPQFAPWKERLFTQLTDMLPQIFSTRSMMRKVMQTADLLLPNSQAEADVIGYIFGIEPEKMRVVYNATDLSFQHAIPDLFHATYPWRNFVLYVGNIGYGRKNHLNLIRAWKGMERDLVLLGSALDTPYTAQVMREVEENERIHYLGFIPHSDPLLASAYAACELFVLPSTFETPGLAALEAVLAGAKVVSTPGGSTREYFGEHVTYLDPHDPQSIGQAVRQALDTPASAALKIRIIQQFRWENVAASTLAAYEELVSRR